MNPNAFRDRRIVKQYTILRMELGWTHVAALFGLWKQWHIAERVIEHIVQQETQREGAA